MKTAEAIEYLTRLHDQYGKGQKAAGQRTLFGMLASLVLHHKGLHANTPMGGWMVALVDDLGLLRRKSSGVIAVAQRLRKWREGK